ncbi:MAG TPA: clostripain-related cysteine peptidase, partial [Candidatus Angelobacter sp.]
MSRIVFLLAICGFGCINDAATAESSWTVMIYADAGDDAMREITDCMLSQLLLVRTTEQVNVIMEVGFQNDPSDKHPGDIHWTKNELCGEDGSPIVPHWSGAYRLALEPDHAGAFKFLEYRGNVDFEATEELSDFIRSAQRCYPAKHNLLIIKAHGPPLPSLFFRQTVLDERTPASSGLADLLNRLDFHDIQMYDDDSLSSTNAIARAVHDIFIDPKLDIIAFDSCFRSFIESAFALATSSDLLIASEDLIYIDERWHYEDWLPKLVLDDALEKEYLGKLIVDSFEMRNASHMAASSLALIDLREIPQLLAPLDQISSQLTATGSL